MKHQSKYNPACRATGCLFTFITLLCWQAVMPANAQTPAEGGKAEGFGGLQPGLGALPLLGQGRTRSVSAENPTGEKGKGGMAIPDPSNQAAGARAADDLGQGWKVRPFIRVNAGQTAVLMDVKGPGIIQHLWLVENIQAENMSRGMVIRFYWDDEETPSVECPALEFFAVGHGRVGPVNSLAVTVNPKNALSCFWPMPFHRRARVTLTNEGKDDNVLVAYQITYMETEVPAAAGKFHAQYRQARTADQNPYVILDGVKGQGRYVGTFMAWTQMEKGWFGEGEVKFYLDGDGKFPTICGTGTEDYFLASFGFPQPYSTAYSGSVLPANENANPPQHWSLYRWHIQDPVNFEQDLRLTIQALGWGPKYRLLAKDMIATVAYWYQTEPHAPFPKLPDPKLAADYAAYLKSTKGILDIRTIHQAKLGANALDLAIVSAGFTAAEQDKFLRHSEDMKEAFFSYPPWNRYRDWVNFHTVFVEDEGPAVSRLKVEGYKGNVLICDNGIASEYGKCAADTVTTLVLHNSDFSTPACGMWGVVTFNIRDTKHSGSTVHELGHGMAGLGDEYIQQSVPFTDPPESLQDTVNVTAEPNPRLCKWHYWTVAEWPGPLGPMTYRGSSPIGNFEGAGWPKGIYRPEEACMMRGSRDAFCAVCDETMQANIFRYAKLFEMVEPSSVDLMLWKGESINFRVAAISPLRKPSAALSSRLDLYMDGIKIANSDRGEVTFLLDAAKIKPGVHQLGAELTIQCEAIRRDFGFLSDSRAWMVKVIPHEKPGVTVTHQVSVPPQGTVNVPVAIQHRNAALFGLRMEHAPETAVLEAGRFKWRPDGRTGSWRVDFIASFEGRDVVTESMVIEVARAESAAGIVEIQPLNAIDAVVGNPVSARLKATVGGGGHPLFDAIDFPEGAAVDRDTGEVTWTPVTEQAGPHRLRFRVRTGNAIGDGDLVVRVGRPGKPSPVSYCNSYVPDTLASLMQWDEGPLLYRRIFESLRLLRDRYATIHEPALAAAKKMYGELAPPYQANVIEELSLHAWSFTDKPAILAWMRQIAEGGKSATQRELVRKLDLMASLDKIKTGSTGH